MLYFLQIKKQVNNLEKVADHLVEKNKSIEEFKIKTSKYHFTFFVLYADENKEKLKELFEKYPNKHNKFDLTVKGLNNFSKNRGISKRLNFPYPFHLKQKKIQLYMQKFPKGKKIWRKL